MAQSTFELAYGSTEFTFEIEPERVLGVLQPAEAPPSRAPDELVRAALASPVRSKKLSELFQGGESTVIVVPDKTRNAGLPDVLPVLLAELNRLGVRDSDVWLLVATGSHSGHTRDELTRLLGADVYARVEVVEHDCRDPQALRHLGETCFGTPVLLNRRLLEADRIVVVATAVHHYFAGYGGGLKMINPGCAGYETISRNHARTIDPQTGGIHPNCRSGVVQGNPVQEDLRDAMRFVKVDFLIETVLGQNGEIVEVVCGDLFAAHERACALVDRYYRVPITQTADLVVVSCGGFPKDINLVQAHKSLYNASQAVREGGVILWLAECREGAGSPTFLKWFDYDDQELVRELGTRYTLNGTTALSVRMRVRRARVVLISTLQPELVRKVGALPAPDLQSGWELARSYLPDDFGAYVIPHGALTLPVLA